MKKSHITDRWKSLFYEKHKQLQIELDAGAAQHQKISPGWSQKPNTIDVLGFVEWKYIE